MEVLYRDRQVVVVVKVPGLDAEHDMPARIVAELGVPQCFCVHRLDKEVGGVMVYALDGKSAAKLTEGFAGHDTVKEYLAVCAGQLEENEGMLRDLLYHDTRTNKTFVTDRQRKGVKEAILTYKAEKMTEELSLLRIRLQTGRSHQIRVQLASRKHPLVGDRRYGSQVKAPHIALWSAALEFQHPRTGDRIRFAADVPAEDPWTLFNAD